MTDTYRITRRYQNPRQGYWQIRKGLTLEEAQEYCSDPETSSSTATDKDAVAHTLRHGPWFDGYDKEN